MEQSGMSYLDKVPTAMTNWYQFAQDHPRLKSASGKLRQSVTLPPTGFGQISHKDLENDDQMK